MNCHICDHPTEIFEDEKNDMTYYRCRHCECIFKSPECYQDFDAQRERYNLHENNEDDAGYWAYFQRFLDFVLPKVTDVKTALDFGCGVTSLLAQMLQNEGIEAEYYDPIYHPNRLDKDKVYDLIVSTEVFEHLHSPKETFSFLLERLKSGGYLALQTQFHPYEVEAFKQWYYHLDPTHIVFFTPRTFKVLCEENQCRFLSDNGKNMVVLQKI